MWYSNSASRLAFLGYAIVFAATARAAEPRIEPPAGAVPPQGFVLAILAVTINHEEKEEPIIALRDAAGRVLVAAADLARWRLRLPDAAPTVYQAERYYPLAAFNGLTSAVEDENAAIALFTAAIRRVSQTHRAPVPLLPAWKNAWTR